VTVAYVQENSTVNSTASTTCAVTLSASGGGHNETNVTSGHILHVIVLNNLDIGSVTIADQTGGSGGSNLYTARGSVLTIGSTVFQLSQFTAPVGTSGSLIITATQGSSQNQFLIWAREISGAAGYSNAGSQSQVGPGNGNDTITTGNITGSTPGMFSAFVFNYENITSNTVTAGTINSPTLVSNNTSGGGNIGGTFTTEYGAYSSSPCAGTFSITSGGSNTYGTVAILFNQSAAAAGKGLLMCNQGGF